MNNIPNYEYEQPTRIPSKLQALRGMCIAATTHHPHQPQQHTDEALARGISPDIAPVMVATGPAPPAANQPAQAPRQPTHRATSRQPRAPPTLQLGPSALPSWRAVEDLLGVYEVRLVAGCMICTERHAQVMDGSSQGSFFGVEAGRITAMCATKEEAALARDILLITGYASLLTARCNYTRAPPPQPQRRAVCASH